LLRDSTEISQGAADGSRTRVFAAQRFRDQYSTDTNSTVFLDSPATTSSITYKVQFAASISGNPVYVNRFHDDTNQAFSARMSSSITLMEIAQ
jgi:hypothetical protein